MGLSLGGEVSGESLELLNLMRDLTSEEDEDEPDWNFEHLKELHSH